MTATTRLISLDDAHRLALLQRSARGFLAPREPFRDEDYFTEGGRRSDVQAVLGHHAAGMTVPRVIVDEDDVVVGRITLSGIARGALESCRVGYRVAPEYNGRGYATDALRSVKAFAFDEMGLHRVQAETLVHNAASQRVLERTGFTRFGLAPKYLKIAGQWQDHVMFQVLST